MNRKFLILVAVAFVIRITWVFILAPMGDFEVYRYIDGDDYLHFAQAFHEGEYLINPDYILRVPLYPSLIAFFSRLPLETILGLRGWHVFLDLFTLSILYLFVKRFFSEPCALTAGFLYAFYPLAIYRLPMLNTEIIQATLIVLWGASAMQVLQGRKIRDALLLSLLSGFMVYINPATQFLPILLAIFFLVYFPKGSSMKLAAASLIPLLVICSLWGTRNYVVTGDFFLFDIRGGKEFWLGNHPEYEGRWEGPKKEEWMQELDRYRKQIQEQGGTGHDFNSFLFQKGIENIIHHPIKTIELIGKKLVRFWYIPASERMLFATIPVQSLYLGFALVGILLYGVRKPGVGLPLFIILYFTCIYSLSYACLRFSHPIMPWVCALGGIGMGTLWQRMRTTGESRHTGTSSPS